MLTTRLSIPLILVAALISMSLMHHSDAGAAPANDNFVEAQSVSTSATISTAAATIANTSGATTEVGEPLSCGSMSATAWYNWTAPSNSPVNIDTFGSDFDTALGIYTGNSVNALTQIGCNDDYLTPHRQSLIRFTPTAGTTYRIQVGGFLGATGNAALSFSVNATLLVGTTADNLNADGALSLREALMVSNGSFSCASLAGAEVTASPGCSGSGSNIIHFLPNGIFTPETPGTITLTSALPSINDDDIISGLGAGVIINGVNDSFNCLTVLGNRNRIHGLRIRNCLYGIDVRAGGVNLIGVSTTHSPVISGQANVITESAGGVRLQDNTSNNELYGNYIGTDAAGTGGLGNGFGVELANTQFQILGGTPAGWANTISGNASIGVWLRNASQNNSINGNRIGTNPAGTAALPNGVGVLIDQTALFVAPFQTTSSNLVFSNLISGNSDDGIRVQGKFATFNAIEGNWIGVNAAGTAAIPNGNDGAELRFTSLNTIGGANPGKGNVISGNVAYGVNIASDNQAIGSTDTPKALPDTVVTTSDLFVSGGFAIQDLTVSINITHTFDGDLDIFLQPPTGGQIELSTDNGGNGDNFTNTVFDDEALVPVTAGAAPFANSFRPESPLSAVDGLNPQGVWRLVVSDDAGGDIGTLHNWSLHFRDGGNNVLGNFIGTTADGYSALGNANGLRIFYSQGNFIGAAGQNARNVISGNASNGIVVMNPNTTDNRIQGNYIGTDRDGAFAIANGARGVEVEARRNYIGGTAPSGNVISGNGDRGIGFELAGTTENFVQGNYIGVRADGTTPLPNVFQGVWLGSDSGGQTIGGTDPLARNYIMRNGAQGIGILTPNNIVLGNDIRNNASHGVYIQNSGNQIGDPAFPTSNFISTNGGDGVHVIGAGSTGNRIRASSIYSNAGLGINNVTGGNTELAPPVITTAGLNSASGTACASCAIDVFRDDGGEGEGFIYLGTVNADGAGNWSFSGTINGPNVTATATNAAGNTSEFSATFACGDSDGDFRHCNDNCPNWPNPSQSLPPWTVPPGDSDCDSFTDARETYLTTDPTQQCAVDVTPNNEATPDRWPFDMNDDRKATTVDVGQYVGKLGKDNTEVGWTARLDLNQSPNGIINTIDVGLYVGRLGDTCSPSGP